MARRFTRDHEWIELDGNVGTVGVTTYAQAQLGDVVYVELPDVGKQVKQGKEAAVLESVKAASEVFAPVDGTVTEVNEALSSEPAQVNADPEKTAWFFRMEVTDKSQVESLMDEAAYKAFVDGLS
jgi:glycine cleavage system H protein